MKRKLKYMACLGIVGLLVFMIVACNNKQTSQQTTDTNAQNSKPVTLTYWQAFGSGHEEAAIKKIIQQYQEIHPNITIKETPVLDSTKILTAISGGNPPDMISLIGSVAMGEWAAKGLLTDLTPYIKDDFDRSAFVDSGWKTCVYKEKVYGLPFANFNAGLLYNKKLFQDAGIDHPPATLEELAQDAALLTKVDSSGKIQQMGFVPNTPASSIEILGWLFGGEWVDSNGKATANDPANIAALTWEKQFFDKYGAQNIANFVKSAGPYLTADDLWESGKVAMILDGHWNIPYAIENKAKVADFIGTAPFPAPANHTEKTGTSYIDTNPQVIPTGAKHPKEAWEFIKWMTTNMTIAGDFSTVVAAIPHLNGVTNYKLGENPLMKVFIDGANSSNAHAWPVTSVSQTYLTKLSQAEANVLNINKDPADELKRVTDEINKLMAGK